ncbi:MAG: methyltransferase domain-containing protein [Pseudomonadota bacterium]
MIFLVCPLCALPLASTMHGLGCSNGHQFDRAKEGYFNLLPVQYKNSREPGDAKQQLNARHAFLKAGFFSPLAYALKQLIPTDTKSLLDIGCGEGYFTRLMSEQYKAEVYGIDIAKAGVRLAAKQFPSNTNQITYVVASSYALPIATGSMDVITRIYAPSKDEELQRVISPQGKLIIVTPGENHLLSLRKQLYKDLRPHPKPQVPVGFKEFSQQQLSFNLEIPPGEYAHALLQMTPFAWQIKAEMLAQLMVDGLQDTADFQLSIYQRNN